MSYIESPNPICKSRALCRLWCDCAASDIQIFSGHYTIPVTNKLSQVKVGSFPQNSLATAYMKLQELKLSGNEGRCPVSELKDVKQRLLEESQQPKAAVLTVEALVELYLTERTEDCKSTDGKIIPGAREKKGQDV